MRMAITKNFLDSESGNLIIVLPMFTLYSALQMQISDQSHNIIFRVKVKYSLVLKYSEFNELSTSLNGSKMIVVD